MRILQVCSYLYPALTYGGPAKVVYDLSIELSKKNKVTIYTTDVWDSSRRIKDREKIKSEDNLTVRYFPNLVNSLAYKQRFFTGFGMVWKFIRNKNEFNLVHIHDVFIIPQLIIGLIAKIINKPYLVSPHGVLDPVRMRKKNSLKTIIYLFLGKPVLRGADYLIATSKKEKDDLIKLGLRKVKVIHNGVPKVLIKPSRKYIKLKDKKKLIILYVGKLHSQKGLLELLESLVEVKFDYQLLLAGPDDGVLDQLVKFTNSNNLKVKFLGFINEAEKQELFSLSDIFVYPSYAEGFSISILEALQAGLPVLITKSCNFPELETYRAGIIIDENNLAAGLRKTLNTIATNNDMLGKFRSNTKKIIRERFNIQKMVISLKKIYEQIV